MRYACAVALPLFLCVSGCVTQPQAKPARFEVQCNSTRQTLPAVDDALECVAVGNAPVRIIFDSEHIVISAQGAQTQRIPRAKSRACLSALPATLTCRAIP